MKTHLIISLLMIIAITTTLSAQEGAIKSVSEKIKERSWTIEVNQAIPSGGKPVYLSPGYQLRLEQDSAFCYLPYYGIAYSAPYGKDGGIRFDNKIEKYNCKEKKGGAYDISFTVQGKDDRYKIYITIFDNYSASLSVIPTNRQSISYHAEMLTPDPQTD